MASLDANSTNMPSYIAVDIRRHGLQKSAPLSTYSQKIDEVKNEMGASQPDIPIVVIIDELEYNINDTLNSDGSIEAFQEEVKKMGWTTIDRNLHMASNYGEWHPTLVNECILAYASALIGSSNSTSSQLAASRVASWAHGPVKMI